MLLRPRWDAAVGEEGRLGGEGSLEGSQCWGREALSSPATGTGAASSLHALGSRLLSAGPAPGGEGNQQTRGRQLWDTVCRDLSSVCQALPDTTVS